MSCSPAWKLNAGYVAACMQIGKFKQAKTDSFVTSLSSTLNTYKDCYSRCAWKRHIGNKHKHTLLSEAHSTTQTVTGVQVPSWLTLPTSFRLLCLLNLCCLPAIAPTGACPLAATTFRLLSMPSHSPTSPASAMSASASAACRSACPVSEVVRLPEGSCTTLQATQCSKQRAA